MVFFYKGLESHKSPTQNLWLVPLTRALIDFLADPVPGGFVPAGEGLHGVAYSAIR